MRTAIGSQRRPGSVRRAQAIKSPATAPVSGVFSVRAPIKGWWAQDNITDMPVDAAYVLDNWFCETDSIHVRAGYSQFASITGATAIQTVMVYEAGASSKIFAATGASIFDVTAGGTIVASSASGFNSSTFVWLNFATSGTTNLVIVNGADSMRKWNGAAWSVPVITGATSSQFSFAWSFQDRLFFIKKNSTTAYYLPVDVTAGAAGTFELGGFLTYGGTLIAGATMTIDSGIGQNDNCVFISSEGEVVIYQGTDPSSASTWELKGVYKIARPIGSRCVIPVGGDLAVLTTEGVISLSRAILLDRAAEQRAAFTGNIRKAFSDRYAATGSFGNWQLISWATGHQAIVNIPITAGATFEQFVMNPMNGSWSRYTGLNALCWATAESSLYFGTPDGKVMLYGVSGSDNGTAINALAVPAFTAMGQKGKLKHVKEAQTFMKTAGSFVLGLNIAADFIVPSYAVVTNEFVIESGAEWGTAIWGVDVWPTPQSIRSVWLGLAGQGYYLSPLIFAQATADSSDINFLSMNLLYEVGATIG